MIEPPRIVQTARQLCAVIKVKVPTTEIQTVMGPTIRELYAAIASQGIKPCGPWFTHHFRRPTDVFDFEACVPVEQAVAPAGRMLPSEWPAMKVARTIYHGGYEGLGAAWGEFMAWIAAEKLNCAEDLWEAYLQGPESGADAAQWRTELSRPLV